MTSQNINYPWKY